MRKIIKQYNSYIMKQLHWKKCCCFLIYIVSNFLLGNKVFAGPPFLTNDPVPENYRQLDTYIFAITTRTPQAVYSAAPATQFDYGLVPNLEINAIVPLGSVISLNNTIPSAVGMGDTQLGIVYRFLEETASRPQVAFTPAYTIPTGDKNRGLGNGRAWYELPFWMQKSFGPWTTYGGGGYAINGAPGMKNFIFGGWLLEKDLNEKWTLGGEVYYQGATSSTNLATTIINMGGYYNFTKTFSFLFSVGHSVAGANNLISYVGIDWTW